MVLAHSFLRNKESQLNVAASVSFSLFFFHFTPARWNKLASEEMIHPFYISVDMNWFIKEPVFYVGIWLLLDVILNKLLFLIYIKGTKRNLQF